MAGLERRTLLKGAGGLAALGASAGALTLFDTPDRKQDPADCQAKDVSATDKRLVFSNWPEYIDEDDKDYVSTLSQFEKDTGIKVDYTADVNDNNEFFAKVSNQLGSCSSSKRDMFALTDWMAARMIQVGWIQKLDASKVPNLHANIIDSLKSPGWDKKRDFSAPWQSGLTGIAYNKSKVGEIKSFSELLTRKDLKGRVTLLSEMRDTMGFMLLIGGRRSGQLHRRRSGARRSNGSGRRTATASSGRSPATTTSRTLPPATSWLRRRGRATSPMPATTTSSGSRRRRGS